MEVEEESPTCLTFRFFTQITRGQFTKMIIISELLDNHWQICEGDYIEESSFWSLESTYERD